jgi:hypothetical protein
MAQESGLQADGCEYEQLRDGQTTQQRRQRVRTQTAQTKAKQIVTLLLRASYRPHIDARTVFKSLVYNIASHWLRAPRARAAAAWVYARPMDGSSCSARRTGSATSPPRVSATDGGRHGKKPPLRLPRRSPRRCARVPGQTGIRAADPGSPRPRLARRAGRESPRHVFLRGVFVGRMRVRRRRRMDGGRGTEMAFTASTKPVRIKHGPGNGTHEPSVKFCQT